MSLRETIDESKNYLKNSKAASGYL